MNEVLIAAATVATINAAIRFSVPIMLGALSGLFSERSGIVNIGIEGMMLMAAFTGFMTSVALSEPGVSATLREPSMRFTIAIGVAMFTGAMMGILHGVLCIQYKVDHIISGTVLNILAFGLTGYFYDREAVVTRGQQPRLKPLIDNPFPASGSWLDFDIFGKHISLGTYTNSDLGLALPFDIGRILFDKDIITYLTPLIVLVVGWALFNTTWGLRTRAVGENPRAADTLGVNVFRTQYTNLFIGGMLAGLAGAFLTVAGVEFERGMTTGRGFIALAVLIFGNWRPSGAFRGALLFGFAMALQGQLQGFGINIPHHFVGMLPYVLTIIVLAGFVGRAQPPAHVGMTYEQE